MAPGLIKFGPKAFSFGGNQNRVALFVFVLVSAVANVNVVVVVDVAFVSVVASLGCLTPAFLFNDRDVDVDVDAYNRSTFEKIRNLNIWIGFRI